MPDKPEDGPLSPPAEDNPGRFLIRAEPGAQRDLGAAAGLQRIGFVESRIAPGDTAELLSDPQGEALIHLLEGAALLRSEGEDDMTLDAGDMVSISGHLGSQTLHNPHEREAVYLLISHPG